MLFHVRPLNIAIIVFVFNSVLCSYNNPIQPVPWNPIRSYKPIDYMIDISNYLGVSVLHEHNFLNDNNIAFSPYGLTGIMVALYEGVDGYSALQIRDSLQIPADRNILRLGFRDVHRKLRSYFVPDEGFLAGLSFNNDNITFRQDYVDVLKYYGYDFEISKPAPTNSDMGTTAQQMSEAYSVQASTSEGIPLMAGTVASTTAGTVKTSLGTTTRPTTVGPTTRTTPSTIPSSAATTISSTEPTTLITTVSTIPSTLASTTPTTEPSTTTSRMTTTEPTTVSSTTRSTTQQSSPLTSTVPSTSKNPQSTSTTITTEVTTTTTTTTEYIETSPGSVSTVQTTNDGITETTLQTISESSTILITNPSGSTPTTLSQNSVFIYEEETTSQLSPTSGLQNSPSDIFNLTESETPTNTRISRSTSEMMNAIDNTMTSQYTTVPTTLTSPLPQAGITTDTHTNPTTTQTDKKETDTGSTTQKNLETTQKSPTTTQRDSTTTQIRSTTTQTSPTTTRTSPTTTQTSQTTTQTSPTTTQTSPTTTMTSPITTQTNPTTTQTSPTTTKTSTTTQTSPTTTMTSPTTTQTSPTTTTETISSTTPTNPITTQTNPTTSQTSPTTTKISTTTQTSPTTTMTSPTTTQTSPTTTTTETSSSTTQTKPTTIEVTKSSTEENTKDVPSTLSEATGFSDTYSSSMNTGTDNAMTTFGSTLPFMSMTTFQDLTPYSTTDDVANMKTTGFSKRTTFEDGEDMMSESSNALAETTEDYKITIEKSEEMTSLKRRKRTLYRLKVFNPFLFDQLGFYRPLYRSPSYSDGGIQHQNMFMAGGYNQVQASYMIYDTILEFAYIPFLKSMAVKLPLDTSDYYLLVILPDYKFGVNELIGDLRSRQAPGLRQIHGMLTETHVRAWVPSFMLKGSIVLTTDLQKMGICDVFEPRQSDFKPMTDQRNVYARNIEQAITVTIRKYMEPNIVKRYIYNRPPVEFAATHPFVFFVMDSSLHVSLMAGKIVNPANSRIL